MTATHTHDLAVAYRIYPSVSRPALGLPFSEDKYRLSEVCLRSFKESLGSLRVKVWAILDGCPAQYDQLFRNYFADDDLVLVPCDSLGNRASFGRQIDILMRQENAPLVYFAEDDYFYLPNQFRLMVDFLNAERGYPFCLPLRSSGLLYRTFASRAEVDSGLCIPPLADGLLDLPHVSHPATNFGALCARLP